MLLNILWHVQKEIELLESMQLGRFHVVATEMLCNIDLLYKNSSGYVTYYLSYAC